MDDTHPTSELIRDQEDSSTLDSPETVSMSTQWTDEKHRLYLQSMEASFVDQLYTSMDLLGRRSKKANLSVLKSSRQMHHNSSTASGQFKIHRDGYWEKINFESPDFQLDKKDESHALMASPWIRHYRSAGKTKIVVSPILQESSGSETQAIKSSMSKAMSGESSSKRFDESHSHMCYHDTAYNNEEVSDQNFFDEDVEGKMASDICSSRKMKPLITDCSGSDQVVPHSKPPITEDVSENCISSARQRMTSTRRM
ncbi:hypothetical protein CFOL_v3_28663 [Cephalotus follicularis]|uniref:Uncharacterized protein n=1 Tax=Cephalotus follicularis TaxID=3775 RepID=A0A1Q3CYJ7_CEPFO|nr:hypothetical protein CFOL_v3_28663 [Cephalotus follicularis]